MATQQASMVENTTAHQLTFVLLPSDMQFNNESLRSARKAAVRRLAVIAVIFVEILL